MYFSAESGVEYTLETSNLGSDCDTFVILWDTDGLTFLAIDDDGGVGVASRIVWTAPASGTYYIMTFDIHAARGEGAEYDLSVSH